MRYPRVFGRTWHVSAFLALLLSLGVQAGSGAGVTRVCATVPDLGSLAEEVGGDRVQVTVFAKGGEDPHFVEVKPAFIKALSQADLYLQVGLELEIGWAPGILKNCRNARVMPGGKGYLDASRAVRAEDVPAHQVDRSMGDVHPFGNPHYLLDPLHGLKVARLLRDRREALQPSGREYFQGRYADFRRRLVAALAGSRLAEKYDQDKLVELIGTGRVTPFLQRQGEEALLGGWLAQLVPFRQARVVADHNLWPYFAGRFDLKVVGFLEPKPGLPPTTKHLAQLIDSMKAQGVRVILAAQYMNSRYAQFVAEKSGARFLPMSSQVGGRPETDDYLALMEYNVRQVATGLAPTR